MTYKNDRVNGTVTSNAVSGKVTLSFSKAVWLITMFASALILGPITFSWHSFLIFILFTAITLCLGHSLGMHRKLIHKSYDCPRWMECLFVHFGVLVGLAGPFGMIKTHDLRDWAQRQSNCHDYFSHRRPIFIDGYWQLFCQIELSNPPVFLIEKSIANDKVYQWMERTWMYQQLPWALLLFLLGGLPWVVWGIAVRVSVSVLGHWLVGYFAHNNGQQEWHVERAKVQGYNLPFLALLTMGESWHNNHHAFPGSANLGFRQGQLDPGWIVLKQLERNNLVWNLVLPSDLPFRPELTALNQQSTKL